MDAWKRAWEEAARRVRAARTQAPEGWDVYNLVVTVTPGKVFSETEAWTPAKFNQLGQPTFTITGTLATNEIANGAVTDVKATPGAWFFAGGVRSAGAAAANKYTLNWGANTAPASLVDGLEVAWKVDVVNTLGAGTVSLDVGVGGEVVVKKHTAQDLQAGDLPANAIVAARYSAAAGNWQVLTTLPIRDLEALPMGSSDGGQTYVVTPSPAMANLQTLANRLFVLKPSVDCKDQATVNFSGLLQMGIWKNGNARVGPGDIVANQLILIAVDNTKAHLVSPPAASALTTLGIAGATAKDLVIKPNGTNRVDVTASEVILVNAANNAKTLGFLAGGTLTIDPSTNGALGLDTGAAAAGWYYVWLIYDGNAVTALCSLSSSGPTLPAGYVWQALLGAFHIDSIGPIVVAPFYQSGQRVTVKEKVILTAVAATAAGVFQALTTGGGSQQEALQLVVPPIAKYVRGNFGSTGAAGAASFIAIAYWDGTQALGTQYMCGAAGPGTNFSGFSAAAPFELPWTGGNQLYWTAGDLVARNRITVTGYLL